jgi:SAM-dependent methyltransferase
MPAFRESPLARRAALAGLAGLLDAVRGRRPCPRLAALLADPSLAGRPVVREVERLVWTVVGRQLTRRVVGEDPRRQSLTDLFARGAAQAELLRPYLRDTETVLEYGGGFGRLGHAVAPHVRRLVSVDINPLMKEYGRRLVPAVEFRDLDELPGTPGFDGAYSVAVFFHLTLAQQGRALEYVHRRLRPGGWFLVDLQLGPETTGPLPEHGNVGRTALRDFRELYEPLFDARLVPLFNSGFLLRRREHPAPPPPAGPADRYAVDEARIVFDVLDAEVVVVNLDNGHYYIMEGTASAIWQMLAAGSALPEIAGALAQRHPGDPAAIAAAVEGFVRDLVEESLVAPATAAAAAAAPASGSAVQPSLLAPPGSPFTPPAFYRYTDMQNLIQMDPIREYDSTGWPRRRTFPPPPAP